jgi:alpha-L-fucosidase 2
MRAFNNVSNQGFVRLFLIFFFSVAIVSCKSTPIKIACVGDSITEGYGLAIQSKTAYPVVLDSLLGEGYEALNLGRSATTLQKKGDFPYWIAKEFSSVFAFHPDIIVIKLGTNDTKPYNWNAADFSNDYQALIDTFRTLSPEPKIFLCYPAPVFRSNWGINDSTVVHGVIPAISRIAEVNNLQIIDLYNGLKDQSVNFPDGIHPNEEAARALASLIAGAITDK